MDVEVGELGSLGCELVEGRSIEVLVAVEREISPALVVGEDDENVGCSPLEAGNRVKGEM